MTFQFEEHPFEVGADTLRLRLRLRRLQTASPHRATVLLLHGGNTHSDIFLHPRGGLAGALQSQFDVWLLDWRGSPEVTRALPDVPGGSHAVERRAYTLDAVVDHDLPTALRLIRERVGDAQPLSIVAHCLSGAAVSMAIARGRLERFGLRNVVLMTLGLFCEVPWNGWFKAENFFLERVVDEEPKCRGLNPAEFEQWPHAMKSAYRLWPDAWMPEREFLRRLTFMIGQPFAMERLHPDFRHIAVEPFFGLLHMGLYMHAAQIVRRGYTAPFNEADVIDRSRISQRVGANATALSDLDHRHFKNKRMALFAAASNEVWHRDSMDSMYEWLRNNGCGDCTKRVFSGYNLQELLWADTAPDEVYPEVAACLAR